MYSLQDSFVGELVGTIQMEAEMKGYYVMLIMYIFCQKWIMNGVVAGAVK